MTIEESLLSVPSSIKFVLFSILGLILISILSYIARKKHNSKNWVIGTEITTYYIIAIYLVLLASLAGPIFFHYILNYNISEATSISASDATNYTLTAFLAIVIASFLNKKE